MNTLYWFHQIHPADREQVGETALHLSRLQQQNCPVLSGFVLSAPCFWEFLESIQWSDPLFVDFPQTPLYLDPQNFQQLQAISRQIRQQILITPLSGALLQELRVALEVLNSAALRLELDLVSGDSPQGLFDLSICWTDLDAVALAVKQTWAELFRARSLFYWNHHRRLIRHLQPIVIVQPLPQTRASGSIHISENLWRIQTVWGLGSMVEQLRDAVRDAVEEIHIHPQTHEVQVQAAGEQTLLHQLRQSEHSQTHSLTMSASSASSASPANPVHLLNLSNLSDLSTPGIFPSLHSPIQAEVMPGSRIQSPILSQTELQSLIHLIHRIVLSTPGQWAIDWIQCWATPGFNPRSALEDEAETQLYLTRILPTALVEILADSHSSPQLGPEPLQLKGLGAAAGRAIARAHVVNSEADATQPFVSGSILVLPELTGTWLPLLKFAAGLVTEQGGMTGHGAILARELGIPAVLQVSQATQQIRFGSRILVDGDQGEVQLRPLLQVGSQAAPDQSPKATAASPPAVPLVALDQTEFPPINTHLMVNLSQISSLQSLQTLPIDGVGLLRSELMAFDILYDHLTLDRVQAKQTAIPIQLDPPSGILASGSSLGVNWSLSREW
ncbi:MAG: hypothetical protein HC835_00170 [Oscillatoriales cyanobacterium RM2_1_1]|nr:hypothetical protein [Oscillatoriales cyanobacterium RM2_1_1]